MKRGEYTVVGGHVRQQFNSGALSIVDVDAEVDAKAIKKISIKLKG
jgi:hypothetical protein